MIPLVYISKISRFYLVSVAVEVSLCLPWSETPEDTSSHGVAQLSFCDYVQTRMCECVHALK